MTSPVVVVYPAGGATPIELAADAGDYKLLFAAPVGDLPEGLAELLAAVGELIGVTDEAAGGARRSRRHRRQPHLAARKLPT
ncbi:hypothetical protein [Amycolatopsis albispora]|uniref:hypothetical protein n=1 Tax=Amycolatopsis albispora TaxID=1804986 RepID=UPI0013B46767|nr:hypothetical protein [Amycolatopsis albispora]